MRGRIGYVGGTVSARLPLRPGLLQVEYRRTPVPLKRTDIPPQAGAKLYRGKPKVKHEDRVVLEVRRLTEQQGVARSSVVALMQEKGIDINKDDVDRYCQYMTRGALVPDPDAKPYL